jgi:hypothetical protein
LREAFARLDEAREGGEQFVVVVDRPRADLYGHGTHGSCAHLGID